MPERTIWFEARTELLKQSSFLNNQESKLAKILLILGAIKSFANCKRNKLGSKSTYEGAIKSFANCKMNKPGFNEYLGNVSNKEI